MISRYFIPVLGMVMGISACRSSESSERSVMMVKTATVKDYQHELQLAYPGRIKAASDVDLSFRVSGPIIRIPVETGKFVRKGELIAEIDPRDYELQFKATEAEYNQVKSEAERVIELYKRNTVPENDYDKAVSGLQQITSKYFAHRNALQDTRLLAPFDGYIQKKYFDVNETIAAGLPVISMINTHYFEVEIDIPSSEYIRQDYFQRFSCVADVFPEKELPLDLISITRKANLNQLYQVRLRLKNDPEVHLAAGMSVNVTIHYTPNENRLTEIPLTAVFEEDGHSYVWLYRNTDQKVSRRKVEIRQILKEGRVVVGEGLESGDEVISAGIHRLKEGMQVRLLKPVSKTNIGGLL